MTALFSQPNSITSLRKVYESYLTDNRQLWRQSIQELNAAFKASAYTDGKVLFELTLAQYGLMGALYGDKPRDDAALYRMIDQAAASAERLLKFPKYQADAHGFLGAILAMRVGLSPMKAIYLGSKSEGHLKKAILQAPNNPTGWVEKGNLRFHSPAIFGGSNQEAIYCFEKAVKLFDQQPELRENNWLYLHAMVWLGQAYEKAGQKEKAIAVYEKAIAFENRFTWVKEELLPAVR